MNLLHKFLSEKGQAKRLREEKSAVHFWARPRLAMQPHLRKSVPTIQFKRVTMDPRRRCSAVGAKQLLWNPMRTFT